jgi:hypothetical protein
LIRFPSRFGAAVLIGLSWARAQACPDARETEFLRGLNREREYALVAYQGTLDRMQDTACRDPQRDLELAKALYQLGAFPRVRALLSPQLDESDARFRHYYFESWLLDRGDAGHPDSAAAIARSRSLRAPEAAEILAAAAFLKGDAGAARSAWNGALSGGCAVGEEAGCILERGFASPSAAAWLSLFPGAGYAYAGRYGDGWFAFSVVSVCYGLAAAYAALDSPVRAWTFAGLGGVFHASNVYGAARAVQAANQRRRLAFVVALHRRWFP